MKQIFSVIIIMVCLTCMLYGQDIQTGTLNGFVFDKSNGESLIGANVYIKDLLLGSSTNLSGYYVIPVLLEGEYTLVCEYMGYETYTQLIRIENGEQRINIFLEESVLETETIVVDAESIRTIEKLYRQPISKIELTPMQIKRIPQIAETDLLRSLQTLPGITAVSDFSSALYVRGGTPDQNLYSIDGSDVYNPEHAFGIFSTFNTDAIKHVDMSKGGYGAEYGGRLSSIMEVTYLDGNREAFEGSFSVSLLSAKTTLQMPLGDYGSISGSIRRTYFDQTIAKLIDEVPDYYFYDGNIKAYFDIDANNKLTVSFFRGRDFLDFIFNENSEEQAGFKFDWGNTTGSVRWTKVFNPRLFANFWVTYSRFSSYFTMQSFDVEQENILTDLTFKGSMEYAYSNNLSVLFGFEQKNLHGIFAENFPGGVVDVDQYRNQYVGYTSLTFKPIERLEIKTGLRYNYFDSDRDFENWGPRLSMKYRLTETVNLKASTGIYHQYLHRIPMAFITSIWTTSDAYQEESSSRHIILGVQKELAEHFSFEAEVYHKNYKSIYQYNQNFLTDLTAKGFTSTGESIYNDTQALFDHGEGFSTGFELLFKKDNGSLTGWIGYGLASTEYRFQDINQNNYFPPRHDRRSVINIVANMNIRHFLKDIGLSEGSQSSSQWLLGINFVYASGQPLTTPSSVYLTSTLPDIGGSLGQGPGGYRSYSIYPTTINAFRIPAYARLDLSVTYKKQYESWSMAPYLQIFNVGNRKNIWFIQYDEEIEGDRILQKVEPVHMLPLLPTLGITFNF
jgi:hypothetical protein